MRRLVRFFAVVCLMFGGLFGWSGAFAKQPEEATTKARAEFRERIEEARKSLGVQPRTEVSKDGAFKRLAQWMNWPNWNNWPNWGNWLNQWGNW